MAYTRTYFGVNQDTSGTPAASLALTFDSTGYTHIVVACSHEGAASTITFSDNKSSGSFTEKGVFSNTFNNDIHQEMGWVKIGSPGASHTVTATFGASRPYCEIDVWGIHADTGEITEEDYTQAVGDTFVSPDAGDLVNSATAHCFAHYHGYVSQTGLPGTGWTEDSDANNNYNQSRTDAAGTRNTAFTWTGVGQWTGAGISFIESAGGGGGSILRQMMNYHGG